MYIPHTPGSCTCMFAYKYMYSVALVSHYKGVDITIHDVHVHVHVHEYNQ